MTSVVRAMIKAVPITTALTILYMCSYCAALHARAPAANMAFFWYAESDYDEALYYFFYPAYSLHKALGGPNFVKHNTDRTPIRVEDMGP